MSGEAVTSQLRAEIVGLRARLAETESRLRKLEASASFPGPGTADLGQIGDREAFFTRVLQSSIDGIYVYDLPARRNVYINPRYTELTGYTLDQINGMDAEAFAALFHPEDRERVFAHMGEVVSAGDGEVVTLEYRFRTRDGEWLWCLSHDVVFERDEAGEVTRFLGCFVDIGEQKEVQEDLLSFSHIAAHDLREPARRIKIYADLLDLDYGRSLPDVARGYVATLHVEADRLLRFINDIRTLTSIGVGEPPRRDPIGLEELIARVVGEYEDTIVRRSVQLRVEDHPRVYGYLGLIYTLYRKLVDNALRFETEGMLLEFTARAEEEEGWVYGVRNTGSTIDVERHAQIFTPFRRFDLRGRGSGLGLSICRRIVDHHNGRIWVEAEDDATHFRFTLHGDPGH